LRLIDATQRAAAPNRQPVGNVTRREG